MKLKRKNKTKSAVGACIDSYFFPPQKQSIGTKGTDVPGPQYKYKNVHTCADTAALPAFPLTKRSRRFRRQAFFVEQHQGSFMKFVYSQAYQGSPTPDTKSILLCFQRIATLLVENTAHGVCHTQQYQCALPTQLTKLVAPAQVPDVDLPHAPPSLPLGPACNR